MDCVEYDQRLPEHGPGDFGDLLEEGDMFRTNTESSPAHVSDGHIVSLKKRLYISLCVLACVVIVAWDLIPARRR